MTDEIVAEVIVQPGIEAVTATLLLVSAQHRALYSICGKNNSTDRASLLSYGALLLRAIAIMRLQYLANIIDQLDLALDQLPSDDATHARFAMMLVDNVMELGMHQIAEQDAQRSALYRTGSEGDDSGALKAALGQRFADKVTYLVHRDLINKGEAESLRTLHRFRNEVYHRGLQHESILPSLSKFYFVLACNVLSRWEPSGYSWSNKDKIPLRAQKYLGRSAGNRSRQICLGAYGRLKEIAKGLPNDMVGALAAHMESTISETDRLVAYLQEHDPELSSRRQAVIDAQVWSLAFSEQALNRATEKGYQGKDRHSLIKWLMTHTPFPIRQDPVPAWNKRLTALRQETCGHVAIKKYTQFMAQTQSFRDAIERQASLLDQHIESQIDTMRE